MQLNFSAEANALIVGLQYDAHLFSFCLYLMRISRYYDQKAAEFATHGQTIVIQEKQETLRID